MYGFWILTIVFAGLLAAFILLTVFGFKRKWRFKAKFLIVSIVIGFVAWGCMLVSLLQITNAGSEYRSFEITLSGAPARRAQLAMALSMTDPESEQYKKLAGALASLDKSIANGNDWYVNAKESKQKSGIWSKYYYLDLDKLEFIVV